jgi:O-antigen/teichoic acid export membrane protein
VSLGRQLLRNIFSSWASYGVRLACGFFFVPYIAATLGGEQYGVWTIIFQSVSYLSLLDLGLERAVVRYVAKFFGERNPKAVSQTLSTATVIYIGLAALIALSVFFVSKFFFGLFHIQNPMLMDETVRAFQILGLFLVARFVMNGFTQTLVGLQRTDIFNALDIFEELARIGTLVALLANGYGLPWLAAGILGVSLLRQLGVLIWLQWGHPEIEFAFSLVDRQRSRELFSFSKISFGISVGWIVIFGSDSILLGMLATPLAAGLFAPAAQLMLYLRHIVNAIGTPLAPAVSQLEAQADRSRVAQTYLNGVTYVGFISFFVCAGVLIYAVPFVHLWLPGQFSETANVMMILAVGAAFFLPQILGNAILFGLERHKYLLLTLLVEAAVKLGLAIVLIRPYGAVGMAIATTVPQLLLYSLFYPAIISRQVGLPSSRVWRALGWSALLAIMATVPVGYSMKLVLPPTTWPRIGLDIIIVTIVVASVGYRVLAKAEDKRRLARFFR